MPDVEVEGPDGNTYQFPDGTDKNAAIKYFKAKGIGVNKNDSAPTLPPTKQGAVGALLSDLKGMLKPRGYSPYPGMDQEAKSEAAGHAYEADQSRKQAGYGRVYRAVVPFAESIGTNVEGMEDAARKGDPGAVIGHAVAPIAAYGVARTGAKVGGAVLRASDMIGIKSRAGAAFDAIEGKIGDAPVAHEPVHAALDKVFDLGDKGFKVPKVAKAYSKWITERQRSGHTEPAPSGGRIDTGPTTPLTFKDARDFYTAFNESIDWDKVPGGKGGKMGRAMMNARHELGMQLLKTANEQGMAKEYSQALNDYHRAMGWQTKAGPVGWLAGKMVGYGAGGVMGHPFVGGAIGGKVGPGIAGSMVRSITEAGRPKTVPSPPDE